MALVIADRVKETTTSTGTGSVTLAGAFTGFQTFSAAIGDGNTTYYAIVLVGGSEWEVGLGTFTASGATLSRDTVLASSNSGSLVNFSAGSKDVFSSYPAGRAVIVDGATVQVPNSATIPVTAGGTGAATADAALSNLGLTATAAELNTLDGITASVSELNIMDGVTATTAELNIMDGVTATTTELNKVDGFTGDANDLNYAKDLRATGVTSTEFDYLDGVTSNVQTQIDATLGSALAFSIALG